MTAKTSQLRPAMPRVEIHGHTAGGAERFKYESTVDGRYDVTPFVRSVRWSHKTAAPWETMIVELELPMRHWRDILPGRLVSRAGGRPVRAPETGFWVVLWGPNPNAPSGSETALHWGRCISIVLGVMLSDAGLVESLPVTLECESWLSLLQKSRIALSAGRGWGRDGFVFALKTWSRRVKDLLKSLGVEEPGSIFASVWRTLVKVSLPNSLVGGKDGQPRPIGEAIPLCFDADTVGKHAPLRLPQQKSVVGYAINTFSAYIPSGNLWDWLSQSFLADPNMVELFPSLEWPCYVAPEGDAEGVPLTTELSLALGGAQPVLLYRMKPLQLVPVEHEALSRLLKDSEAGARTVPQTAAEDLGIFQKAVDPSPSVGVRWYSFARGEVFDFRPQWSDADRINGVSVQGPLQPQTQIEMHGLLGSPQVNTLSVEPHGLRWYKIDWPFLPAVVPDGDPEGRDTLHKRLTALAELGYMMLGGGEHYCGGSLATLYKPWIKAGHWIDVEISETPGMYLTAYLDDVTHDVVVAGDKVTARTSLRFSRGTLNDKSAYFISVPGGTDQSATPPDVVFATQPVQEPKPAEEKVETLQIKDKPGTFQNVPARSADIAFIVIHHTVTGSPAGTVWALKSKNESTHFEVDTDGTVWRYCDPALFAAEHTTGGGNATSIGVDVTHASNAPWPPAQVDAVVKLCQYLVETYGLKPPKIPPDNKIFTPAQIAAAGYTLVRHRNLKATECPQTFPMDKLLNVKAKLKTTLVPG